VTRRPYDSAGQTVIALLLFMMLAIMVTTAAATITVTNIQANNGYAKGEQSLMYAESGIDEAMVRLGHDENYAGGTIAFANGTATISVSGTSVKTIISHGTSDNYHRTVTATVTVANGVINLTSWSETP